MLVNVARPLQVLQWSTYLGIVFLIEIFLIFPLAALLFHDFFIRLLPPDSSQWSPLSVFQNDNHYSYQQAIKRVPVGVELPMLIDNGLSQHIPLRSHIIYKADIDFQFFCLKDEVLSKHSLDSLEMSISKKTRQNGMTSKEQLYHINFPILCLRHQDTIAQEHLYKEGPHRMNLFKKEWLNKISIDDKIEITTDADKLILDFKVKSGIDLIMEPKSALNFRMEFQQEFRNLMLRWTKLTHVIGTIVFHLAITSIFLLTGLMSFIFVTSPKPAVLKTSKTQ